MTDCKDCNLHLSRKKVINGTGRKINPLLTIVLDPPTAIEEISGLANATNMGKVIYKYFSNLGFSSSDCYFTHVVKCKTPNNRPPDSNELKACSKHLYEEFDRLGSKYILAVGLYSSLLLTGHPWTTHRGVVYEIEDKLVTSTYPPDVLMKQQHFWSAMENDVKKLLTYKTNLVRENYLINPPEEIVKEYFEKWKDTETAVDIETSSEDGEEGKGLNPYRDDIMGIAFTGEEGEAIQLTGINYTHNFELIKSFLEPHQKLVFQNHLFDIFFLRIKGIRCSCFYDTFYGLHLIDSRLPKKLDFQRSLYSNFEPYKSKDNYKYNLAWLNCRDTDTTLISKKTQALFVKSEQMSFFMKTSKVALNMRERGVNVDKRMLGYHFAQLQPTILKMENEFQEKYNLNVGSPKQLSDFLFNQLNFDIPRQARKGKQLSVDEEVLSILLERCVGSPPEKQILQNILDYRGAQTIASKFCTGVLHRIESDNRVHADWRPLQNDTWRWKCKNPNLQNIPEFMRDCYPAPEGKVYFEADYTGMQLWGLAILSGDKDLLAVLKDPSRSIHREVEAAINLLYPLTKIFTERYGEEIGKAQSYLAAKAVVFGTIFGRTAKDIAETFKVKKEEALLWQEAFFGKFYDAGAYMNSLEAFWKHHGYVEGLLGFRKYTQKVTEAKNAPVQNFEAYVVSNSLIKLEEEGFHPILMVHDQDVCEEDENESEDRFKLFQEILETAVPELYPHFPIKAHRTKSWKKEE